MQINMQRGVVMIMSEQGQKLLNRFRELYDEEQRYNEENYGIPFKELADDVLLAIALDEAIIAMNIRKRGMEI